MRRITWWCALAAVVAGSACADVLGIDERHARSSARDAAPLDSTGGASVGGGGGVLDGAGGARADGSGGGPVGGSGGIGGGPAGGSGGAPSPCTARYPGKGCAQCACNFCGGECESADCSMLVACVLACGRAFDSACEADCRPLAEAASADAQSYHGCLHAGPCTFSCTGSGGTGGVGCTVPMDAGTPPSCPQALPGPALVAIPNPGGPPYCIDRTEVTNRHYEEFLAGNPSITAQPPQCAWNTSFVPSSGWPAAGKTDHPVTFVDHCDARAYCEWAGKRLCGRIGGGSNSLGDFVDPARSEWYRACSGGTGRQYPYGTTYDPMRCIDSTQATLPVGCIGTCEGGVPGLYDLSGSVWEWVDACDPSFSPASACRIRGGSFLPGDGASNLSCAGDATIPRASADLNYGIRCCAG